MIASNITEEEFNSLPEKSIALLLYCGSNDVLTLRMDEMLPDYLSDNPAAIPEPTHSQVLDWHIADLSGNERDVIVFHDGEIKTVAVWNWD